MLAILTVVTSYPIAEAQTGRDEELARMLARDATRNQAVATIVSSGPAKIPLLLSWATKPPDHLDVYELNIGLADVFGQTKTKEAIPFLIRNISIDRTHAVDTWIKSPKVIEERLAAAAALIRIGPEAAKAVTQACWRPMLPEDRVTAIFVVSRIKDNPDARAFLTWALGEANLERYAAEDGLKRLDGQR